MGTATLRRDRGGMRKNARDTPPWLRWVTVAAIVAPAPYSLSRLIWALGIPLGIDGALLREFDSPGIGSVYMLLLALLPELTALVTQTFILSRRKTVPQRVPLVGGLAASPALVVPALLPPIVILTGFNAWSLGPILDGFVIPAGNEGLPGWSFWGQIAVFWVWGTSLTIATAGYWWSTRGRSRLAAAHEPGATA